MIRLVVVKHKQILTQQIPVIKFLKLLDVAIRRLQGDTLHRRRDAIYEIADRKMQILSGLRSFLQCELRLLLIDHMDWNQGGLACTRRHAYIIATVVPEIRLSDWNLQLTDTALAMLNILLHLERKIRIERLLLLVIGHQRELIDAIKPALLVLCVVIKHDHHGTADIALLIFLQDGVRCVACMHRLRLPEIIGGLRRRHTCFARIVIVREIVIPHWNRCMPQNLLRKISLSGIDCAILCHDIRFCILCIALRRSFLRLRTQLDRLVLIRIFLTADPDSTRRRQQCEFANASIIRHLRQCTGHVYAVDRDDRILCGIPLLIDDRKPPAEGIYLPKLRLRLIDEIRS